MNNNYFSCWFITASLFSWLIYIARLFSPMIDAACLTSSPPSQRTFFWHRRHIGSFFAPFFVFNVLCAFFRRQFSNTRLFSASIVSARLFLYQAPTAPFFVSIYQRAFFRMYRRYGVGVYQAPIGVARAPITNIATNAVNRSIAYT